MTKSITTVAAMLAAAALTVSVYADTPKAASKTAAAKAAPNCPFCKMPLGAKKTAKMPVAIKMNGKTYYTCAPCKTKVAAMKPAKAAKAKAM